MAGTDFDRYVGEYREIINRVSKLSGEEFEFFIQLRIELMKGRLVRAAGVHAAAPRILDFGCGTGTTELYLRQHFPDSHICGLDASLESVRAAASIGLERVSFIHSEEDALPFPDDSFDLVYSNGTYHHIDPFRHHRILAEMARICSPGGSIFIFENNPLNPLMMRAMRNNPFDADAIVVHPGRLGESTRGAGFVNREICYYFFFPKWLSYLRGLEKWLGRIPFGAQYFLWAMKSDH